LPLLDEEGKSIYKEDLDKYIRTHNSKLNYIYKDIEVSKEYIKELYLNYIMGNLI
jgi:hypothetical protein